MAKKSVPKKATLTEDLRKVLYEFQLESSAVKVAQGAMGSEIRVDPAVIEQALQLAIKGLNRVYDDFDRIIGKAEVSDVHR